MDSEFHFGSSFSILGSRLSLVPVQRKWYLPILCQTNGLLPDKWQAQHLVVGEEGSSWQRGFEQALPCGAATKPASREVSIGRLSETEKWVVWEKNLRVLLDRA